SGQRTLISYQASDPLRITKVTDPFGRSAVFGYNSAGQLTSITDAIGITSSFQYGPGNFVTALTTPYGTTPLTFGDSTTSSSLGTTRFLQVVDALGRTSRYEYNDSAPGSVTSEARVPSGMNIANAELNRRNTYIWNPTQYAEATKGGGLDYTKA